MNSKSEHGEKSCGVKYCHGGCEQKPKPQTAQTQKRVFQEAGIELQGSTTKTVLGHEVKRLANGDVVIPADIGEAYARQKWEQLLEREPKFFEEVVNGNGIKAEVDEALSNKGMEHAAPHEQEYAKRTIKTGIIKSLAKQLYDERDNGFIFGFECDAVLTPDGRDTGYYVIRNENGRSVED